MAHMDAAYSLAWWLMRDRSGAEDVVQDALLRALTYFPGFRGGNARAWLLQIVRNAAYAALRQRHPAGTVFLDEATGEENVLPSLELADPGDNPEAALLKCRDQEYLHTLMAELPAELRECLILKELEALPYKEIALITGVPVGTVMSRLWRARQLLLKAASQVSMP